MSQRVLNTAQMAAAINAQGGGSFEWQTQAQAQGPGYMVALRGSEERLPSPISASDIKGYKARHGQSAQVAQGSGVAHSGFWGTRGSNIADVSVKVEDASTARTVGNHELQEAAYALPGTEVQPGTKIEDIATKYGGDVLLSMRDHGASLGESPEDPQHWGNHEVQNPSWKQRAGKTRQRVGRGEGPLKRAKVVTLGDIYRAINRGRVEAARQAANEVKP